MRSFSLAPAEGTIMSEDSVCIMKDVAFSYGKKEVLTDVSLCARPGEMVVLAGPNGSGKSSTLRILAGLQPPDKGSVSLFGTDGAKLPGKERSRLIAYVPQLVTSDIPFTVSQTVRLGRAPWQDSSGLPDPRDNDVIAHAMQQAHIDHLADRSMRSLSGGECQRVAIARAMCQEPKLFLLDEPTTALDYGHQIQIMDMLHTMCKEQNVSIILVSHDVNLAAMYADTLLLMRGGRIAKSGTPGEVITQETISALYTCSMLVDTNPRTQTPRISPLPMAMSC